jgi:hypothetical protein
VTTVDTIALSGILGLFVGAIFVVAGISRPVPGRSPIQRGAAMGVAGAPVALGAASILLPQVLVPVGDEQMRFAMMGLGAALFLAILIGGLAMFELAAKRNAVFAQFKKVQGEIRNENVQRWLKDIEQQ